MRGNRQTKAGTRHPSPAHAAKVGRHSVWYSMIIELALSADEALLFRSVGPFHHRGNGEFDV
jgi:hypothetical protein